MDVGDAECPFFLYSLYDYSMVVQVHVCNCFFFFIGLKDGSSDDWACEYVVVSREGEHKSKTFPLYTFVEKEVAIIGSESE